MSGLKPAMATKPGSSPSASEMRFQRKKGEVVGSRIILRSGCGRAKYVPHIRSDAHEPRVLKTKTEE